MKLRHVLVVCSLVGALGGGSLVAEAQGMTSEWVAGTHSYIMTLQIGPPMMMISQDDAAAGMSGDVLAHPVPGGATALSMPAATAMINQTTAPNRHIEVQIDRRGTLTPADNLSPTFKIMNQDTGETQRFDGVPAMFDASVGGSDLHYGVNAFIPDGLYTITVIVANEEAAFQNVILTGATAAAAPVAVLPPVPATGTTVAPITTVAGTGLQSFGQQTKEAQMEIQQALTDSSFQP